jgi:DNA-binding transcriptional LysR family regulator
MTTTTRLRAFVELADTGSVRAAARRLVVSESSVSSAVSALADELRVPLLVRQGRGVRLTPAGERYASYARRVLGLLEEAAAAARGAADAAHGEIRLAAVTTAGEHVLPAMLASFRAEYPDVTLSLEVSPRASLWPMLAHHEVDLVVAGRPPDSVAGRVRATSPNTLVVVAGPAVADGFEPGRVTWLLREAGSGTRATTKTLLAQLDVAPSTLTLGSHGAVVAAAAAGLGAALVSRQAVRAHLSAGELVELALPPTPLDRPWHVVSRFDLNPTVELLVAHLLARPGLGWRAPRASGRSGGGGLQAEFAGSVVGVVDEDDVAAGSVEQ